MRCRSTARLVKPIPFIKKPGKGKGCENVATAPSKPALWVKLTKFLREVRSEMRKVSWPSRKELITYTIVVIITMIVVALFTSVVDVLISGFLNLLARLRG